MPPNELLWSRWDDVDALLSRALDLPSDERSDHVVAATAGDEELRALVLRLLARLATNGDRLTTPSGDVIAGAFGDAPEASDPDLVPGAKVGQFVIVRRRARGGMATVYEATRADGAYRQQVALKVLRRGLDTDDMVRRFLTERQILSSLSHPNIARLLDGGSTPAGRPYLVMELVEGAPITALADTNRLDVLERLALFLQVADAVHAAHRQLVVHRDIKPSNILVDADRNVKLLDFGIAKLLEDDAEHTQAGWRAMTPDYASPEQLAGGAVTTATDVYQLGLLLRELLTGVRPLAGKERGGDIPVRASRLAIRTIADAPSPAQRAAARGTTPQRLRRLLAGDLDTIVAKALRPEPEQRYASADGMASDVRRYLRQLPIAAHPESRAYRIGKFVRRNRWGVIAAGTAGIALVGYALTITVQSRRVAAERDRATQEAAKAEQVTRFLVQLFRGADPNTTPGERVTARELLDRGAAQIEHELGDEPAVRAAMLAAIGQSYYHLGHYTLAQPLLERAVEERRAAHGPVHRAVASDLSLLAVVTAQTDATRALDLFPEALGVAERAVGPAHALVGKILADYAALLGRRDSRDPRVTEMLDRAVTILRASPGDNRSELAHALTVAAYGRSPDIAIPLMREGLALRQSLHGELHTATASSLSDLALATEPVDPLAADSLMQRALEILDVVLGRRHATTLVVMNNLAGLRRDRGAYAEAVPLYREVLSLRRALYPKAHTSHAFALYGLGLALAESDDPRDGERHLREALGILRRTQPPGSPLVSLATAGLGYALARQHRFVQAEPLLLDGHREIIDSPLSVRERARTLERVIWMYRAWRGPTAVATYQQQLDSLLASEGSSTS